MKKKQFVLKSVQRKRNWGNKRQLGVRDRDRDRFFPKSRSRSITQQACATAVVEWRLETVEWRWRTDMDSGVVSLILIPFPTLQIPFSHLTSSHIAYKCFPGNKSTYFAQIEQSMLKAQSFLLGEP